MCGWLASERASDSGATGRTWLGSLCGGWITFYDKWIDLLFTHLENNTRQQPEEILMYKQMKWRTTNYAFLLWIC